jgi:hypothetical protein
MGKVKFIASVKKTHLNQITEVSRELEAQGLQVDQVMRITGVITGTARDASQLRELNVPGIAHIESDQDISIGPPDPDVQ